MARKSNHTLRQVERKRALAGPPSGQKLPLATTPPRLSTPRAIAGSLPVDFRASGEGGELVPARIFAPPHLRCREPVVVALPPTDITLISRTTTRSSELVSTERSELTINDGGSTDAMFLEHVETMLADSGSDGLSSRFQPSASDTSYDFDEYIFLRDPDDPFARGLATGVGASEIIPSDPRFTRFVNAADSGIDLFVDDSSLSVYPPPPQMGVYMSGLKETLRSWWLSVCAVRSFNQLSRYSRSEIRQANLYGLLTPEAFYGDSLRGWLLTTAASEVQGFLAGNGDNAALGKLLTVGYWEEVRTSVFEQYFRDSWMVDPAAPEGDYSFEPFPADEVLFGLRVIHRQTWHLLGNARGDLVKTIPLGPKESQKVSVKILRRTKTTRTTEEATSQETSSEASTTAKNSSEVVAEASEKLNQHAEAEVSGGYGPFIQAKVSGGLSQDIASSSKQTKNRLNEMMEKTASRMKRDTKVAVSTESEDTFELTRSSELTNPNDEIAVTYLYHRLQQRFWVSTEIGEVHSVVFVPEPLPDWNEVDEHWIQAHGDTLAAALLDSSFAPILTAIRKEPPNLAYTTGALFEDAARAGIAAAQKYPGLKDGGSMPDLLGSGQQYFEQDFERRNNLAMEQARRAHQSSTLLTHIRRNILHYMRAIWKSEDYDQRMQRFSRLRVPTAWYFVPLAGSGPTSPLEVEGVFMPDSSSARPLTEVINPIGPIGFLFNCGIYLLRDDTRLANLNQALAYLRATYTRFVVKVTFSAAAGTTLRQVVAYAPRSFAGDYTFTYRLNRKKWLIPRPGLAEIDWFEVKVLSDGSLDALGLRIWLDGVPADQETLTIRVRATADLEDPHLRLVQIANPLPATADEPQVFTDSVLHEMTNVLPQLSISGAKPRTWADLSEAEKVTCREQYHRFVMLRDSGRLVTLDTANVLLDLEISQSAALEPFKRLHRYLDVLKEYQEMRRRVLDNTRREELLKKGVFGDPDIERVTLVGASDDIKNVIGLTDTPDE